LVLDTSISPWRDGCTLFPQSSFKAADQTLVMLGRIFHHPPLRSSRSVLAENVHLFPTFGLAWPKEIEASSECRAAWAGLFAVSDGEQTQILGT
jgi:hypothetical protein